MHPPGQAGEHSLGSSGIVRFQFRAQVRVVQITPPVFQRKLPTGRAELYAHCVRVLLEYWRRDLYASELGTGLQAYDAEAAQAVLARVAWHVPLL